MNTKEIEKLLAQNPNVAPAPVVKAALDEVLKREQERQVKETISNLEYARARTVKAVRNLQFARQNEKKAKMFLTAVSEAENKYVADGDWAAYTAAVDKAELDSCKR